MAQNCSDYLDSYPVDNCHCSYVVYWRAVVWAFVCESQCTMNHAEQSDFMVKM